jgi:hypothetical protein
MKLSIRPIPAMCIAVCGIVLATPALAQDEAAPAETWAVLGENREYTIFAHEESFTGSLSARAATGMMVLKEPNEQGVGAQQSHYVFDCGRERFTVTGLTFVMAAGYRKIPQPGDNIEKRWRDDQVAKSVGELACGDAYARRTFRSFDDVFAEARR